MPYTWDDLNSESDNPDQDELDNLEKIELAERIGYVFLSPVIISTGILGCIATLIVLNSKKFNNRFYTYLKGLAIADLAFLVFAIFSILAKLKDQKEIGSGKGGSTHYFKMYYEAHVEFILTNGFLAASAFITVLMTLDRYHAICRPTFYFRYRSNSAGFNSPRVDIGLAFYCGIVLQLPRYFSQTVLPKECMLQMEQDYDSTTTLPPYIDASDNSTECTCERSHTSTTSENYVCVYDNMEIYPLTHSTIWMTYIALSEIIVKILPSILLVVLNVWMIQDFNASIRRKRKLKATCFTITNSELFNEIEDKNSESVAGKNPVEIQGWRKRISSFFPFGEETGNQVEIKNIETADKYEDEESGISSFNEDEDDDEVFEMQAVQQQQTRPRRRSSQIILVNANPRLNSDRYTVHRPSRFLPDDIPKLLDDMARNRDKRDKAVTMSDREKNVIVNISMISCIFVLCNVPLSICRIMSSTKFTYNVTFQIFLIISNLLELLNTSFNFYCYFVCNPDLRAQTLEYSRCWKAHLPGRSRAYSTSNMAVIHPEEDDNDDDEDIQEILFGEKSAEKQKAPSRLKWKRKKKEKKKVESKPIDWDNMSISNM